MGVLTGVFDAGFDCIWKINAELMAENKPDWDRRYYGCRTNEI
jgi:hypothetical protein